MFYDRVTLKVTINVEIETGNYSEQNFERLTSVWTTLREVSRMTWKGIPQWTQKTKKKTICLENSFILRYLF